MGFPEGSNMKAPEGFKFPLGPFSFPLTGNLSALEEKYLFFVSSFLVYFELFISSSRTSVFYRWPSMQRRN